VRMRTVPVSTSSSPTRELRSGSARAAMAEIRENDGRSAAGYLDLK
jgi:hypothetical protein